MPSGGNSRARTVIENLALGVWAGGLAYSDWRWRRLPNSLLLVGVLIGGAHWLASGVLPFGAVLSDASLAAVAGLLIFLPFYVNGWMGAGDVKMFAVLGWLGGLKVLCALILYGSALAGLLAILLLSPACRDYMSSRQIEARLRGRIPLGAGLAIALIALLLGWLDINALLGWWPKSYA